MHGMGNPRRRSPQVNTNFELKDRPRPGVVGRKQIGQPRSAGADRARVDEYRRSAWR